jgi:hypothetical protein
MLWRAAADTVERGSFPQPAGGPATLEIDPQFRLPDWYTDWDIHVFNCPEIVRCSKSP